MAQQQSQARLDQQFPFTDTSGVQIALRLLVKIIEGRLGALEDQRADFDTAIDDLTATALFRINEVLKPSLEVLADLVAFGFEADRITDSGVAGRGVLRANTHNALVAALALNVNDLPFLAPKASPGFTGTPTAPTAAASTNTDQLATTAFVRAAVAALIAASPAALDTLKELADALGNDPNFSTTVLNALADRYTKAQADAKFVRARNLFINSGMRISQERGNDPFPLTPTGPGYIADGWVLAPFGTGTVTGQRVVGATPAGSAYRIQATVTSPQTSLRAGDCLFWESLMEGIEISALRWGTPQALPACLRLGLRFPAGVYTIAFRNVPAAWSYTARFVVSDAEANTDIVRTFAIPPQTSGTWGEDTGPQLGIAICLACGSTYKGPVGWNQGNFIACPDQSNFMATNGAVAQVFDVGAYIGSDLPTFALSPLLEEEARCRRYFQTGSFSVLQNCYAAGGLMSALVKLLDPMRSGFSIGLNVGFQSEGVTQRVASILGVDAFRVHISANNPGSYECTGTYTVSARL